MLAMKCKRNISVRATKSIETMVLYKILNEREVVYSTESVQRRKSFTVTAEL